MTTTKFSTKLAAIEQSRAKPSTKALDELQEAFMRLGANSQAGAIADLRERADDNGSAKLSALADLLQNVVKPGGAKPPARTPAPRTVSRTSGNKSGGSVSTTPPAREPPAPRTVTRTPGTK